jgi:hypothetical protein
MIWTRWTDDTRAHSLSARFRRRRAEHVKRVLWAAWVDHGRCRVLDLGGRQAYWRCIDARWLREHNVTIDLLNINTVQATEIGYRALRADACSVGPLGDGPYDVVHSNSVIEHVGSDTRRLAFARNVRSSAPRYIVQTPAWECPVEPHVGRPFFHWMPREFQVQWQLHSHLGHWPQATTRRQALTRLAGTRLLRRHEMASLFSDADIVAERFIGLPKSWLAVRNPATTLA